MFLHITMDRPLIAVEPAGHPMEANLTLSMLMPWLFPGYVAPVVPEHLEQTPSTMTPEVPR